MKKNNNEKIIIKCLDLIDKGYSLEYCLKKYKAYEKLIREYFNITKNLRKIKNVKPSADFKANVINNVYNNIEKKPEPRPIKRLLKPAIIFVSIFILFIFSSTGVIYASEDSIPGETLYTVKRSAEDFQLFLYPENREARLHYKFLNRRLEEAEILLNQETPEEEHINMLIEDISKGYKKCQQNGCFVENEEEKIIQGMNEINNKYQNKYGQKIQFKYQNHGNKKQFNQN